MDSQEYETGHVGSVQAPRERKRLNLKPRDPAAAARLEEERLRESHAASLFGDAKPREVVIADRVGKSEEDVVKEEVKKEKLHLRLSPEQNQERMSHEAAVKEIEKQIEGESDEKKRDLLHVELKLRQDKLDDLMERFVNATLETAKSGEAPRMSHLRKLQQNQTLPFGPVEQVPGAVAPGVGSQYQYNNRYNPTQQYHQQNRGGHHQSNRGGYQNRGAYHNRGGKVGHQYHQSRGGARGGHFQGIQQQIPEWAREEYSAHTSNGMIDQDGSFYDVGFSRGRGRQSHHTGGHRQQRDHIGNSVQDVFYQGPYPGRGVGGEIEFDSLYPGQDRY